MMPSLGSHLSPNNGSMQQTFADLHDIHYQQNNASPFTQSASQFGQPASQFTQNSASQLNFPVNATIHHHSSYNIMDRPIDGASYNGTMTSQGPPGKTIKNDFKILKIAEKTIKIAEKTVKIAEKTVKIA